MAIESVNGHPIKEEFFNTISRLPTFTVRKCCVMDEWPVRGSCGAAWVWWVEGSSGPVKMRQMVYVVRQ